MPRKLTHSLKLTREELQAIHDTMSEAMAPGGDAWHRALRKINATITRAEKREDAK